ncbi:MAG: hypothetical protein PUK75_04150 [bacterium]|nr:hypothetical protein [bacterium]MDY4100787.1 hypothetical protein [Lachnospiraceae bacterium]
MSDEKWNRFTVTGSVRDYLDYRACIQEMYPAGRNGMREEREEHGTDHPSEWNGALCNAHRGLR